MRYVRCLGVWRGYAKRQSFVGISTVESFN